MIAINYKIELHDHRCPSCGKFWASEYKYGARCADCLVSDLTAAETRADRLARSVRVIRARCQRLREAAK